MKAIELLKTALGYLFLFLFILFIGAVLIGVLFYEFDNKK